MCWHPLAEKLQRNPKMTDTLKLQEAAESGLSRHALFGIGVRCLAFDHRIYVDDKTTPLSMTMQPGTVVNRSVEERRGRLLADVLFDSDPRVSKGHFVDCLESLPNDQAQATRPAPQNDESKTN